MQFQYKKAVNCQLPCILCVPDSTSSQLYLKMSQFNQIETKIEVLRENTSTQAVHKSYHIPCNLKQQICISHACRLNSLNARVCCMAETHSG